MRPAISLVFFATAVLAYALTGSGSLALLFFVAGIALDLYGWWRARHQPEEPGRHDRHPRG